MGPVDAHGALLRVIYTRPGSIAMLLILDAIIWLQRTDIVDYEHRVQDIPASFIYDVYDFVVVGAGSAGAAVAARLSEVCNWNVLLLEAGPDETYLTDLPYLYPALQRSSLDWKFRTEPNPNFCQGMENNQCAWPRGKVLGGSSVLNALMYIRGNAADYDEWESFGNVGWSWKDILPYFIKMENVRDPKIENQPYHGRTGPITVELFKNRSILMQYFFEAARQMNQTIADEMNGPSQLVFGPLHGSIRNGLRCSTAKGYLRPVWTRNNFHVSMKSMVEKILIDPSDKRAYGVLFKKNNRRHYVLARKEVILSAGSLNTPQLLMLSGVGPKAELESHGIEVIHDSPGVGKNLQDHVATGGITFLITNPNNTGPLSLTMLQSVSASAIRDFIFNNSGIFMNMPSCQVMGFINTKYAPVGSTRPDIQIFMSAQSELADGGTWAAYGAALSPQYYATNFERWVFHDSFLIMPLLMQPKSRGYLKLRSKNPYEKIRIYPNYFAIRHDIDVMIEGLKFCLKLAQTPALKALNATLIYKTEPNATCSGRTGDDFYECLVRHFSQTIYHPIGTTKMGPKSDPMAVVDDQLRVHGIAGLRVVDAGIMPTIVTGNTNAAVIMIGEKGADLIKASHLPELLKEPNLEPCGCCGSTKKRTIVGGWAWAWWLVTDVQRLSLEVMTLNPMCEMVETAQGVPLTVTGVAQCKIMKMMNVYYFHHQADELLGTASEQFLGKSVKEIKMTILQTLEGHLRAILGTLTVEEVYKDRDQFAALVREVAAPDVGRMGIEILSFTIKDVYDDVQYLQSLGKAQTASVKRDADAGVAEANRDAGIREAECEKSAMDVKYSTDTKIEDNARMYKLQKANFDQEINTAKAESQLAYELQAAKIRQKIRNEEIQIDIVERRKQIEIETQEIARKECELSATVKLPAEAESYRVQTIAEGKRTQTVANARAEAERIKKIGAAEAEAIEMIGKAEAERMRMKANVYKQYGDAAIMNIVLESLPKIAAEIAAPLAKTEEIVLIGGNDNTTADVTRLVGQLPPAINALTGVDLSKVLGKIPGAKA